MTIGSQKSPTALSGMKMVRDLADSAQRDTLRIDPPIQQIHDRLASIIRLMDEVVLPVYDLAPIEHASDIERRIVGKLVTDLLAAGQNLTIWNGGDKPELKNSRNAEPIFAALAASDQDEIVVSSGFKRTGWIRLVWGNDADVISDYSTKIEHLLAGANALAEELSS